MTRCDDDLLYRIVRKQSELGSDADHIPLRTAESKVHRLGDRENAFAFLRIDIGITGYLILDCTIIQWSWTLTFVDPSSRYNFLLLFFLVVSLYMERRTLDRCNSYHFISRQQPSLSRNCSATVCHYPVRSSFSLI